MNNKLKLVSSDLVSETIIAEYELLRKKIVELLSRIDVKPWLDVEYWSSRVDKPFLGVTIHFIDQSFSLCTFLLDLKPVKHPHTAENTASAIRSILLEYNIENVATIVSDNAKNIDIAIRSFQGSERKNCFAHILNILLSLASIM
ncbi:hypothetical protein RCL1_003172 [Eukaryota sp. TZLM3-RCL]